MRIAEIISYIFMFASLEGYMINRKKEWLFSFLWFAASFFTAASLSKSIAVSKFIVLFCAVTAFFHILPIYNVKIWNTVKRKKLKGIRFCIFLFFFLIYLSFALRLDPVSQSSILYTFSPIPYSSLGSIALMASFVVLSLFMAWYFTWLFVMVLDSFFAKSEELVLISLKFLVMKRIFSLYYLEGINNGVTYQFQMTKKMYLLLKREKGIRFTVKKGIFGGYYISKNPILEENKRTLIHDKRTRKTILFISILAVLLYVMLRVVPFFPF